MNLLSLLNSYEIKYLRVKNYFRNETIFLENSICNKIAFIIHGEVKIVSFLSDGKEIIYQKIGKNGFFGNNLLFSSSNFYKGNVVATINCKIAFIDKEAFLNVLSNNKMFLAAYLENISNTSILLNQKIKLLSLDNAKERVLYYLYIHNNNLTYKSITTLANEIFLSRECLSRTLKSLKNEKEIKIENKTILVCQ